MSLIKINELSGNISSNNSTAYVADKISLQIDKNTTIGILGESGSGKTQLAMTLSGLNNVNYRMESGSIDYSFNSKENFSTVPDNSMINLNQIKFNQLQSKLKKDKIYGNKIGIMFQDPGKSLNPYWTIGRHIKEILMTKNQDDLDHYKVKKENIYRALKLDIELDDRYPNELSGGQQQRIVVAIVLLSEPDIIIADEIATGVDASVKRELLDYLLYVKYHTKSTIVIITHDIGFLLKIADRIILMYKGAAIQSLDADIVKSVLLTTQYYNSDYLRSDRSPEAEKRIDSENGFDSITKQLHPYLKGLLRSHIYKMPLEGDIPDPKKMTGDMCPFVDRCADALDECNKLFPRLNLNDRSWNRCVKLGELDESK